MSKYIEEFKYYAIPSPKEKEYSTLLNQQWDDSKQLLHKMKVNIASEQVDDQRKALLDKKLDKAIVFKILSKLLLNDRFVFFDFLTQKIDITVYYTETITKWVPEHYKWVSRVYRIAPGDWEVAGEKQIKVPGQYVKETLFHFPFDHCQTNPLLIALLLSRGALLPQGTPLFLEHIDNSVPSNLKQWPNYFKKQENIYYTAADFIMNHGEESHPEDLINAACSIILFGFEKELISLETLKNIFSSKKYGITKLKLLFLADQLDKKLGSWHWYFALRTDQINFLRPWNKKFVSLSKKTLTAENLLEIRIHKDKLLPISREFREIGTIFDLKELERDHAELRELKIKEQERRYLESESSFLALLKPADFG